MWRFLIFLFLLGLVAAGLVFADYNDTLDKPLVFTESQRVFVVEKGWSSKRVAAELEKSGVIEKPHWFYLYARMSKKGTRIKSGEYNISGSPTIPELIDQFIDGQTVQYTGKIIEGSTFKQLRVRLAENADLVQTMASMSDQDIMKALDLEGQHPEGLFFSDTFQFPNQTTDLEFLSGSNEIKIYQSKHPMKP